MNELKHGILLKKAKKYFESFPNKTSTILKMKIGNIDTHWNVQRQKGQLQITEINSSRNVMTIKEDLTVAGGKGGEKPFEYDPTQKPGKTQQMSDQEFGKHQQDVRQSVKANVGQSKPPPLPPKGYQQVQNKMKGIRGSSASDFEPDVIKRAAEKLSDQEFGTFYGFSKKSALQRQSTPPPLPSRIKKAGTVPYGTGPYQKGGVPTDPRKELELRGKEKTLTNSATRKGKIIREASPAFSKISAAFMDYMAKQDDHIAQSNFINTISREKAGLVSQQEKDSVAAIESQYLGQATKATDASTKQTPLAGMKQQQQQSTKRPLTQGVERKYRVVLREADGDIKGIDQTSDTEQPEQSSEQLPEPEPQKSGEEKAISKLAGQTIKSADIQFDENSGKLTLTLAGTQHPAVLEWSRTGKVKFLWKGQVYTIKK